MIQKYNVSWNIVKNTNVDLTIQNRNLIEIISTGLENLL